MRQPQNAKRGRGRGRRGNNNGGHNHVPNRNTSYESNGPDVKLRGNAQQLHEKYMALAHDAATSGERISAEAYTQFADHYFRLHQAAVGVAESKRQQDQADTLNADGPKSSDLNQNNGLDARAIDNIDANSVSNDSKASAVKANSDNGAKLSPAKLAEAVQGDQDGEQPA
ncbi:DUF4167 domain-containing protein [Candidatus Puniceispirillum sp.]|nr:DUF4167 domain-containing protein [Candidatus Puniceispirillum sp.]